MGDTNERILKLEERLKRFEKKSANIDKIWNYTAAILVVNIITMLILIFQK